MANRTAKKEKDESFAPPTDFDSYRRSSANWDQYFQDKKMGYGFTIVVMCFLGMAVLLGVNVLVLHLKLDDNGLISNMTEIMKATLLIVLGYVFGTKNSG